MGRWNRGNAGALHVLSTKLLRRSSASLHPRISKVFITKTSSGFLMISACKLSCAADYVLSTCCVSCALARLRHRRARSSQCSHTCFHAASCCVLWPTSLGVERTAYVGRQPTMIATRLMSVSRIVRFGKVVLTYGQQSMHARRR